MLPDYPDQTLPDIPVRIQSILVNTGNAFQRPAVMETCLHFWNTGICTRSFRRELRKFWWRARL